MRAQEAIDARRAAEATRRGGGEDADTFPKPASSSSSGEVGHTNREESSTGRAALAPISRATLTPIKENGSSGSAPVPVVAFTTEHVRQGDKITEEQVRQTYY